MACATFFAVFLVANLLSSCQALPEDMIWCEDVTIPEDVSVGTTVKHLLDFVNSSVIGFTEVENGKSWSVNITGGNDMRRFEVDVENMTLILTAPLDYEFYPRYNLSLELTNTEDSRVQWFVSLTIVVIDVPGYPPYYDKRCETPVLPDNETDEPVVVSGRHVVLIQFVDGVNVVRQYYDDTIPPWHHEAVDSMMEECSLRLCVGLTKFDEADVLRPQLEAPQSRGRIEFQCRDPQLRSKGKLTFVDYSLNDTLPEWAQGGRCDTTEGVRYIVLVEGQDMWSTSIYEAQCDAIITFYGTTVPLEFMLKYNITGCPEGRYGLYCDNDCVCKNGARCHGFNGACECRPGWRGRACDVPWSEVVIVETPGDSVVKYIGTNLTLTCLAPHIHVANISWLHQAESNHNDTNLRIVEEAEMQNSSINHGGQIRAQNLPCLAEFEPSSMMFHLT